MAFAFSSYRLLHLSMANINFIQKYGLLAIKEGALYQSLEILIGSAFALFCYLGFKICETELSMRYHRWKDLP